MLVISRKENEAVEIENIKITIVNIRRGRVAIGIDAPQDRRVVRSEIKTKGRNANERDGD